MISTRAFRLLVLAGCLCRHIGVLLFFLSIYFFTFGLRMNEVDQNIEEYAIAFRTAEPDYIPVAMSEGLFEKFGCDTVEDVSVRTDDDKMIIKQNETFIPKVVELFNLFSRIFTSTHKFKYTFKNKFTQSQYDVVEGLNIVSIVPASRGDTCEYGLIVLSVDYKKENDCEFIAMFSELLIYFADKIALPYDFIFLITSSQLPYSAGLRAFMESLQKGEFSSKAQPQLLDPGYNLVPKPIKFAFVYRVNVKVMDSFFNMESTSQINVNPNVHMTCNGSMVENSDVFHTLKYTLDKLHLRATEEENYNFLKSSFFSLNGEMPHCVLLEYGIHAATVESCINKEIFVGATMRKFKELVEVYYKALFSVQQNIRRAESYYITTDRTKILPAGKYILFAILGILILLILLFSSSLMRDLRTLFTGILALSISFSVSIAAPLAFVQFLSQFGILSCIVSYFGGENSPTMMQDPARLLFPQCTPLCVDNIPLYENQARIWCILFLISFFASCVIIEYVLSLLSKLDESNSVINSHKWGISLTYNQLNLFQILKNRRLDKMQESLDKLNKWEPPIKHPPFWICLRAANRLLVAIVSVIAMHTNISIFLFCLFILTPLSVFGAPIRLRNIGQHRIFDRMMINCNTLAIFTLIGLFANFMPWYYTAWIRNILYDYIQTVFKFFVDEHGQVIQFPFLPMNDHLVKSLANGDLFNLPFPQNFLTQYNIENQEIFNPFLIFLYSSARNFLCVGDTNFIYFFVIGMGSICSVFFIFTC